MQYYFMGDKIRSASVDEKTQIGMESIKIWSGRLMMPIEADDIDTAWAMARVKAAEYEGQSGMKVINLGWTSENPYDKSNGCGAALRSLRLSLNLTQQSLADLVGINIRQIQQYESGERDIRKAAAETVAAIAKALGTTVENLI